MEDSKSEIDKLHEVDRRALLWIMKHERSSFLHCVDYTLDEYKRKEIDIDKEKLIKELHEIGLGGTSHF